MGRRRTRPALGAAPRRLRSFPWTRARVSYLSSAEKARWWGTIPSLRPVLIPALVRHLFRRQDPLPDAASDKDRAATNDHRTTAYDHRAAAYDHRTAASYYDRTAASYYDRTAAYDHRTAARPTEPPPSNTEAPEPSSA